MTVLVTRPQWGARPRKVSNTSIIDHPSVTGHWVGGGWEFPWSHSSCDDKVRGIQASHMDSRGWSDIAYNYLACPHDFVYEGRGYDRRSSANGTDSANNLSFAICCLWGSASTDDPLPEGLKKAFLFARNILRTKGGATSVVKKHKDWKSTDCPGDQVSAWIDAGLPVASTSTPNEDKEMISPEGLKQLAITMVAVLDQEVRNGNSLHELVQLYSAFNARNAGENKDLGIAGTDLVLADDFAKIEGRIGNLETSINQLTAAIQELIRAQTS